MQSTSRYIQPGRAWFFRSLTAAALLSAGLMVTAVPLAAATTDQRFVYGVEGLDGAFVRLSSRADALAFRRGTSPSATLCKHYQGLVRKDGVDGTPYLFLTKSGNVPDTIFCGDGIPGVDDEDGYLMVIRMGSRDKYGERLRRNLYPLDDYSIPVEDRVVTAIPLDGNEGRPGYRHPGGMQLVDDVLAIGTENPVSSSQSRATILFFDVSDPANPRFIKQFDPPDLDGPANANFGADPVGLTPVRAPDGTCCRYLMVTTGGPGLLAILPGDPPFPVYGTGNADVRFYRSLPNNPDGNTTTLRPPDGAVVGVDWDLGWEEVGRYSEAQIEACNPGFNWPTGVPTQHQMLNFVREGSLDGRLYLLGGWRDGSVASPLSDEDEFIDLWRVNLAAGGIPAACPLTFVNQKRVGLAGIGPALQSWGNFLDVGSFAAGSGVHVTPSGEMLVYVSDHRTTLFGEYRQRSLVRPDSPTLRPTASVGGPFAVDEGSTVQLTGQAEAPITRAFVQLFEDRRAGVPHTGNAWLSVEYQDRNLDQFDDLCKLNLGDNDVFDPCGDVFPDPLWDKVSSLRWFAPPGCNIQASDFPTSSGVFPGDIALILRGTGRIEEAGDLAMVRVHEPPMGAQPPWPLAPPLPGETDLDYNIDNDIEGVTFYTAYRSGDTLVRRHGCDSYYNAGFSLGWDLDNNGSFETSGTAVSFSAAGLDGPGVATVRARATHATDTSTAGTGVPIAVSVQVRNVPPQIGAASVTDGLGQSLDGGTRPALAGLPVSLSIDFTDPGRPDTQTASIDWNDGSPPDTTFASFSDARGGATGRLRDTRVYTVAGSYTITATITDDDGGTASRSFTITVLSLEDALQGVADRLTQLIATAPSAGVAAALTAARDELIGNLGGLGTNGALDRLAVNDPVSAVTKIGAAITNIMIAEASGAGDLSSLKSLLGLVAEGIATGAYQRAEAAVSPPKPGQAKNLATMAGLIQQGHAQLLAGQYVVACDAFRQATEKALALLR